MNSIPLSKSLGAFVGWKQSSSSRTRPIIRAQSDSGKVSYDLLDSVHRRKIETVTLPPDNVRLKRELADIVRECSAQDWDGYGARPINRMSVQHVCQFLEKMPSGISYPELAPEPTGDLTMVWRKNGYHLIIGIDSAKQIAWGGTSSHGHVYGDARFDLEIPRELINLLYSVEGVR